MPPLASQGGYNPVYASHVAFLGGYNPVYASLMPPWVGIPLYMPPLCLPGTLFVGRYASLMPPTASLLPCVYRVLHSFRHSLGETGRTLRKEASQDLRGKRGELCAKRPLRTLGEKKEILRKEASQDPKREKKRTMRRIHGPIP